MYLNFYLIVSLVHVQLLFGVGSFKGIEGINNYGMMKVALMKQLKN